MYNIIRKIFMCSLILLCASCGNDGIAVDSVDKSYTTDTITVNACVPQLKGLASSDLEEKVNNEYMTVCTRLLNEFSDEAKKTKEESVFNVETTQHYNRNGFLSIVTQIDSTARKTKKNRFRITKNIDTKNCVEVELSALFADDSYIDVLNGYLEKKITESSESYTDLWEKPKITENQRYYINDMDLVIFYPPYELSYYERGFVEIPVKLSDISGYLKPEYREQFLE